MSVPAFASLVLVLAALPQAAPQTVLDIAKVMKVTARFKEHGFPVVAPALGRLKQREVCAVMAPYTTEVVQKLLPYLSGSRDRYANIPHALQPMRMQEWDSLGSYYSDQSLDDARFLVDQFAHELAQQGQDPNRLKLQIDACRPTGVQVRKIVQELGEAQIFEDVPENHWAYELVEGFKKRGLLVGYPDGLWRGPRPFTRLEFALSTIQTVEGVDVMNKRIAKGQTGAIDKPSWASDLDLLDDTWKYYRGSFGDDVQRFATEFAYEMRWSGVDPGALISHLDADRAVVEELHKKYRRS